MKPCRLNVVLLSSLLGACAPATNTGMVGGSYLRTPQLQALELSDGAGLSQSFWPTRNGLSRVTLMLATYGRGNSGTLTFALVDELGQVTHRETFAVESATGPRRDFSFRPQRESAQHAYFVQVQGTSPHGVGSGVWADRVAQYPGRLRMNGAPIAGSLALEWAYDTPPALFAFHLVRTLARFGPGLLVMGLLWTLPGLALIAWVRRSRRTAGAGVGDDEPWSLQRVWATSVALSGALLLVLPQLTGLLNLPLGSWAVWALLLVSGALLWRAHRRHRARFLGNVSRPDVTTLMYAVVAGLTIVTRLVAVHPLSGPQWGDSVHHSIIAQLMLDGGGIVHDYAPYLPLRSFTYHAGFHLLSAWLAWAMAIAGTVTTAATAVLMNGQLLNVWSVITVGLLAEGLVQRAGHLREARWAGVVAVLVAGLLNPMPAFYVNWGRYTQLAGQVFLAPAVLWTAVAWGRAGPRRELLLVVLAVAATALSHYGVALMFGAALAPLFAILLWERRHQWRRAVPGLLLSIALTGLAVTVMIVPSYWSLSEGQLVSLVRGILAGPARPRFSPEYNAFADITTYVPPRFLMMSAVSLCWLLVRRRIEAWLLAGWVLALFVLSNPYTLLRLPGTGLVDNLTVQIALYVPLSALVAIGAADVASWLVRRPSFPRRPVLILASLAIVVLAVRGAWRQALIVDPERFAMLTRFDQRAAAWIAGHTPDDVVFHVNGFFAYADSVVAGSDGGWWLWLTARRQTTVPPIVYAVEAGVTPNYRGEANERFRRLSAAQADPDALAAVMRQEGIEYVYVGAQQGRVGLPPGGPVLDPTVLHDSSAFETVYTDDFVWVFRLR